MRIVFFGTDGPLSVLALRTIGMDHRVVGVVRAVRRHPDPQPGRGARGLFGRASRILGWRRAPALARVGGSFGAPTWPTGSRGDPEIAERVAESAPDLICIAGFPWLLEPELLAIPSVGALNSHAALLPRHRGPLPLFWIYYHDDRETGATIHRVTAQADAGDILDQESFPLPRGFPVERLNRLNAERGAVLFRRAVAGVAAGRAIERSQDQSQVTLAPMVRPGARMIDFERWDVERVWHFCAGLFPRFIEPLISEAGAPFSYSAVRGYSRERHDRRVGTVIRTATGFDLCCLGGRVHLRGKA